jgi:glycosyltransferase involved in cell wall biosynthesis
LKIAVVSSFYSEGMGYTENCLPKALARLGHEVHLLTSQLNVYGNESDYNNTYESFLGCADQGTKKFITDGYTVHRLNSTTVSGYVLIKSLITRLREINPEFVYSIEIASLQTFQLAAIRYLIGFRLFAETHQHLSVVKPYMKNASGGLVRKAFYRLTRTMPTCVASLAVERCYAIAPDCVHVAHRFYGVPMKKLTLRSLGTDTELFHPPATKEEIASRDRMRRQHGYSEDDIVCIYTGRLSESKNPLILAQAVDIAARQKLPFRSLFIGEGNQKAAIASYRNAKVLPFMKHSDLADIYRMGDIAVWPRQESMSMLDATSSGLPLIVSENIGDKNRIDGNGRFYSENHADDLVRVLMSLGSQAERHRLGNAGRAKMEREYSWDSIARKIVFDYLTLIKPSKNPD